MNGNMKFILAKYEYGITSTTILDRKVHNMSLLISFAEMVIIARLANKAVRYQ